MQLNLMAFAGVQTFEAGVEVGARRDSRTSSVFEATAIFKDFTGCFQVFAGDSYFV
jgi:hypothetical protein